MTDSSSSSDRYQITLHAENLPNRRFFGTSCPYAKVKVTSGRHKGTVLGETATVVNNLSPEWTKTFFLEFSPAEVTNLEVTIWDDRGPNKEPQWMGEANFEATSVYQAPGNTLSDQIGRSEKSRYVFGDTILRMQ
jgi:Ca2+-dependent lipid-binding protein